MLKIEMSIIYFIVFQQNHPESYETERWWLGPIRFYP